SQDSVFGARMTGGGFGGCTINLVRTDGVEAFCDFMAGKYREITRIEPENYILESDDRVREEDLSWAWAMAQGMSDQTTKRQETLESKFERERNPLKRFFMFFGPCLITGASDDDPSGIGTYTTAGASLGFATLWTAIVTLPMMAAIQF